MVTHLVSYSELDTARQCPLKHQLAYRERWQPPEESAPLRRGKLMHAVLEAHYNLIKSGLTGDAWEKAAALRSAVDPLLYSDDGTASQTEDQELVEWMYAGYVENYGLDPEWEILEVEKRFEAWLPDDRLKSGRSTFRLKGTLDLLIRDHSAGGGIWIVDHKTGGQLPKQKDLDFDDQMGLYTYLLRSAGVNVRGIIWNAIRSKKLVREMTMPERYDRLLTVRGDAELKRVAEEALADFREAYRRKGQAQRHPDNERCGWRCPFTEPCLASRGRPEGAIQPMLEEYGFVVDLERH